MALVVWLVPHSGRAGTTGKIAGTVLDAAKRPVVAATVAVTGSPFGAFTNDKGQNSILNVPSGTYEVKISRIGFKALVVRGAVVSPDQTTRLDGSLEEAAMTVETVVVRATRPPVDVDLTSSMATLQSEEIARLPVQELTDIVNLQAGVVDGHFRGGRLGEVQVNNSQLWFSPDGKWLAFTDCTGTAVVRDITSGEEKLRFAGTTACINAAGFSPDGKLFAVNAGNRGLKILDFETGQELLTLPGGFEVEFTPDGTRVITVTVDERGQEIVRTYLLQLEDIVALAKTRLSRSLTTEECRTYLHMEQCPSEP